ncbi:hypothetical protein ENSA5_05770 [Enhygromyxa salina]|uniref:Uncharacterized protein n=1 Tax=Enhygromyxa salina TaxID=215803 RepID=A0A2S9YHS7_9BACT|nr:hypothetical protein [Enhygromyxa salina]PRQ04663.1 hypothetical protein ENSA5_05770 [Enhygromyxa salina]
MDRSLELSLTLRGCWSLAALVMATPMIGCGPGGVDNDTFRVTSLAFDGDDTLTLTFTKPIANAAEIDPNDFRISLSRTFRVSYQDPYNPNAAPVVYEGSYYGDLAGYVNGYGYDYDYGARFSFASASLGASDQLVLEMSTPLGAGVCDTIEAYLDNFGMSAAEFPGSVFEMGLFVHYAGQDIPLESERGEALVDIGPDWVLSEENYMGIPEFGFPRLGPRLQIPCS